MTAPTRETISTGQDATGADKAEQPHVADAADLAATVQERADDLVTLAEDLFDHAGQLNGQCDQAAIADLAERIARITQAMRRAIRRADKIDLSVARATIRSKTSAAHKGERRRSGWKGQKPPVPKGEPRPTLDSAQPSATPG